MSKKVKTYINDLFIEMNKEISSILSSSPSATTAIQNIMEYVSSSIAAASQGFIVDIYGELSRQTLSEEFFQTPENANRFYELNMRKKIAEAYQFDVQNSKTYSRGIDFKEINRAYVTAGAAAGSAAIGGILLGALSGVVDITKAVVIGGTVLTGIVGGSVTYAKIVPEKNKTNLLSAVNVFMSNLESELLDWVDEVVRFYNQEVEELKSSL